MLPMGVEIDKMTIGLVKDYLRVQHDKDDMLIGIILTSAQDYIEDFLGQPFDNYRQSYVRQFDGTYELKTVELPRAFTMACLALCAYWYENRSLITARYENGTEVPYMFTNLLLPYRVRME